MFKDKKHGTSFFKEVKGQLVQIVRVCGFCFKDGGSPLPSLSPCLHTMVSE